MFVNHFPNGSLKFGCMLFFSYFEQITQLIRLYFKQISLLFKPDSTLCISSAKEKIIQFMQSHLAEESWTESCKFIWHVLFIHVVEFMEGGSGREPPLHQVQHRHHA